MRSEIEHRAAFLRLCAKIWQVCAKSFRILIKKMYLCKVICICETVINNSAPCGDKQRVWKNLLKP